MPSVVNIVIGALTPQIVIFTDEQVDRSCQINGCKSLDELFKPWQSTVERVPVLSSNLSLTTHSSYNVRFISHSTLLQSHFGGGGTLPYSPEIVVDIVANLVRSVKPGEDDGTRYEVLRDVLFASTPVDSQGTFNHPVCRLFAISTSNPAPLDTLSRLADSARQSPVFSAKSYIESSFKDSLRFFLVVHDTSVEGRDLARARQILFQVEQVYGPHCSLLVINSSSPHAVTAKPAVELDNNVRYHPHYASALKQLSTVDPFTRSTDMLAEDVIVERSAIGLVVKNPNSETPTFRYARHLGKEDISNIRDCIRQLVIQSVIPWMEARVREWNEVFIHSRKGLAGKLLGAGKKLFGGPERVTRDSANYDVSSFCSAAHYTVRRTADFAFMLRDYHSAMIFYDAIRQDYLDDTALISMSNVVVMHSLSSVLSVIVDNVASETPQGAMPHLLQRQCGMLASMQHTLSIRCLPSLGRLELLRNLLYLFEISTPDSLIKEPPCSAAMSRLFVSASQAQTDQLFSAILLERAAFFDAHASYNRGRKRALHLALSAWHYQHCGLERHYTESLLQVMYCLQGRATLWRYIEENLQYSFGRQTSISGDGMVAVKYLSKSMKRGLGAASQATIFEDILLAYQHSHLRAEHVFDSADGWLPSPVFTKPTLITTLSREADTREQQLELIGLPAFDRIGSLSEISKDAVGGDSFPECNVVVDSTFRIVVTVVNPSNIPFVLANLHLIILDDQGDLAEATCTTPETPNLILFPLEEKHIPFDVVLKKPMIAEITALAYSVAGRLHCSQRLMLGAPSSNSVRLRSHAALNHSPQTIRLRAMECHSSLQCRILDIPHTVYDGESAPVTICLENDGLACIQDVSLCIKSHRSIKSPYVTAFNRSVPGVLSPTEKLTVNALVTFSGESEMDVEIALEYKQDGCRSRKCIVFRRVIFVWPSISSSVFPAFGSEVEGPPISSLDLELENQNGERNLCLISLNVVHRASQSYGIPRMAGTILRPRQVYRDHVSMCLLSDARGAEFDTSQSHKCSCAILPHICYLGSYPTAQAIQTVSSREQYQRLQQLVGTNNTPYIDDDRLSHSHVTIEISLKPSFSENFQDLTRLILPSSIAMQRGDLVGCLPSLSLLAAEGEEGIVESDRKCATFDCKLIILRLVDVVTLGMEDRCKPFGSKPQENADDRAGHSRVSFAVWNCSSVSKMKWKLWSVESVPVNPSMGSSRAYYIGRTQFTGVLQPQTYATPVSSAIHHEAGCTSLENWVLEWAHGDADTWQTNQTFQHRFHVMRHAFEGLVVAR